MWDKFDIEIPFHPVYVNLLESSSSETPAGFVDCRLYDMPLMGRVTMVDGQPVIDSIKAQKWDSITSGLAGVAVGFFPEGNGFNRWPHVRIKASPAKILQGHNVFGPECVKQGIAQMFSYLQLSLPKVYQHLDIESSQIKYTDSTYSCRVPSFFRIRLLKVFENLATARQRVNSKYTDQGYIQLGHGSEYQRQKVYCKDYEILADIQDAKRCRHLDRLAALSDPRLHDWVLGLQRFEATTGPRKFEALGIPTRVSEFVKFCEWFESVHHEPLCRWLWSLAFDPLFAQFEGRTMKHVNDDEIRAMIDKAFLVVKDNGKVCKRKANAVFDTYRKIKMDGYDVLCRDNNSTFFRNVAHLQEAGISKAFLKSLDPHSPSNVISMVELIKIDFSQQRPDWYVEPKAGYEQPGRHLRLVG